MKLAQINHLLAQIVGCTFASMDTVTEPSLTGGKSNPHKGRVAKHTLNNRVMLFTNSQSNGYENMVRRRLQAEGKDIDFSVAPLQWGTRRPDSPLIDHNGKVYLQVIFLKGGESTYTLDGQPIEKEDIQGLPKPKADTGRQQLDKEDEVIVRTFMLDSIAAIRLMGEEVKMA